MVDGVDENKGPRFQGDLFSSSERLPKEDPMFYSTSLPVQLKILTLALILSATVGTGDAFAQLSEFHTTLRLQDPVTNSTAVDRVVYRWSGYVDGFDQATEFDVMDFRMELWAGGTAVYVDTVVSNWEVQNVGGQPRQLDTDFFWDFNMLTMGLEQMRNFSEALAASTAGIQFHVDDSLTIPADNRVSVWRYEDGTLVDSRTEQLGTQHTDRVLFQDGFESGGLSGWSSSSP